MAVWTVSSCMVGSVICLSLISLLSSPSRPFSPSLPQNLWSLLSLLLPVISTLCCCRLFLRRYVLGEWVHEKQYHSYGTKMANRHIEEKLLSTYAFCQTLDVTYYRVRWIGIQRHWTCKAIQAVWITVISWRWCVVMEYLLQYVEQSSGMSFSSPVGILLTSRYHPVSCLYWSVRISGGRVKTWKRRWFILTDNCLYYFEYTTVSQHCSCQSATVEQCDGNVIHYRESKELCNRTL